jgi:hypothetical protein
VSTQAILITLISSVLSGLLGVAVSSWFFYKFERHKQKMDLARRLLGNRFSISGDAFSCAMNEVIAVFSDAPDVLTKMEKLFVAIQVPGKPNAELALVDFLKSVCKESGLSQGQLNDTYLLQTFNGKN